MQALIVEDEPNVSSFVRSCLESEGFQCAIAHDGEEGLRQFQYRQPDLILLDLNLPKMGGLEVCTHIRQSKTVKKDPFIIMITGKGSEVDRIVGYATGADDYITKPFSAHELVVRIRALLRRNLRHQPEQRMIETPHFLIDCQKREVLVQQDNGEIHQPILTPSAFDLLVQMASHPKRVWTWDELVESMRGEDFSGGDRAIDTYIGRLRAGITATNAPRDRFIKTHIGIGYSFEDC